MFHSYSFRIYITETSISVQPVQRFIGAAADDIAHLREVLHRNVTGIRRSRQQSDDLAPVDRQYVPDRPGQDEFEKGPVFAAAQRQR